MKESNQKEAKLPSNRYTIDINCNHELQDFAHAAVNYTSSPGVKCEVGLDRVNRKIFITLEGAKEGDFFAIHMLSGLPNNKLDTIMLSFRYSEVNGWERIATSASTLANLPNKSIK